MYFAYLGSLRGSIDSHLAHHQHHAKGDSTIFIWKMDPMPNRVKKTLYSMQNLKMIKLFNLSQPGVLSSSY